MKSFRKNSNVASVNLPIHFFSLNTQLNCQLRVITKRFLRNITLFITTKTNEMLNFVRLFAETTCLIQRKLCFACKHFVLIGIYRMCVKGDTSYLVLNQFCSTHCGLNGFWSFPESGSLRTHENLVGLDSP